MSRLPWMDSTWPGTIVQVSPGTRREIQGVLELSYITREIRAILSLFFVFLNDTNMQHLTRPRLRRGYL